MNVTANALVNSLRSPTDKWGVLIVSVDTDTYNVA